MSDSFPGIESRPGVCGGDPCIVLFSGNEKKAGYQLSDNAGNAVEPADIQEASAPAAQEPTVSEETAEPAAVVGASEPDYESPLADGTVVLSRNVAAQLDAYLNAVGRHGVAGSFYVTPDGRGFGSFACGVPGTSGLPGCPMKSGGAWVDPQPDSARVKQRAHDACLAGGSGDCTMLYSNETAKAKYSVVK